MKEKRPERFAPGPLEPEPGGLALARGMARRGAAVLKRGDGVIPVDPARMKSAVVIFPALGSLAARIMIERPLEDEAGFVREAFSEYGVKPSVRVVAIEPSGEQVEEAARDAAAADIVVLFCFDAHLYPSNKRLLDEVQRRARRLVVVLMRDPYDAEFIGDKTACVTGFGFRMCQLEAAIAVILRKP